MALSVAEANNVTRKLRMYAMAREFTRFQVPDTFWFVSNRYYWRLISLLVVATAWLLR
jgi:hypothetical protein